MLRRTLVRLDTLLNFLPTKILYFLLALCLCGFVAKDANLRLSAIYNNANY